MVGYDIARNERQKRLLKLKEEGRKQAGVEIPSPSDQPHLLITRLNLSRQVTSGHVQPDVDIVRNGLRRLCGLFERIQEGEKTIDELDDDGKLSRKHLFNDYQFTVTIGFGLGFFDRLDISKERRPKHLREMPDHAGLGDPTPYSLVQTDVIIQIASSRDYVNRWVMENTLQADQRVNEGTDEDAKRDCPEGILLRPNQRCCPDGQIIEKGEKCTPDITSALEGWATVVDVNEGFQRLDGRNLLGFNDGVSNPIPGSALFDGIVWTTMQDEGENLKDGTYMVYQKIEHDLDQWRRLPLSQQEEWVGRKKNTGLIKGSLSDTEDRILGQNLQSPNKRVREEAERKLKELIKQQRDPTTRFYDDIKFKNAVPAWSHIRKANPREELIDKLQGDRKGRIGRHLIYRRGYLFVENDRNSDVRSGLQFICFQKNIDEGFEFIKKNWLNNKNFPIPFERSFTDQELTSRHRHGRLTSDELLQIRNDIGKRKLLGLVSDEVFNRTLRDAGIDSRKYPFQHLKNNSTGSPIIVDTQNTGREGLAGPSELGVNPTAEFLTIVPLGGGYYFVPPIPKKSVKDIGQQFFE